MSDVTHLSCPACKGAVGFTQIYRIITCAYCGTSLLVEAGNHVPEYYAEHKIDKEKARRILQKFLLNKALPQSLMKHAAFKKAELSYLPFNELKAKRAGTIERVKKSERYSLNSLVPPVESRDTAVITGDVHRIEPAVAINDLGIEDIDIMEQLRSRTIELLPFSRSEQGANGRIFIPEIDPSTMIEQMSLKGFANDLNDHTGYMEIRARRIFYPVWRLQYRFKNRVYNGVIDGVTGHPLFMSAPQGDNSRIKWLVAGVSISAFVFGKMLKQISFFERLRDAFDTGLDKTGSVGGGVILIIILSLLLALLWIAVWNQFRYSGDVVLEHNTMMVEKHGGFFAKSKRVPLMTLKEFVLTFIKGNTRGD
ncbi:MAG: hypothetical protein JXR91_06135 [Deltaproteobacteria bacterium]|nr:hypothetical protein [Deltaproteobacteria bacterium]